MRRKGGDSIVCPKPSDVKANVSPEAPGKLESPCAHSQSELRNAPECPERDCETEKESVSARSAVRCFGDNSVVGGVGA